MKTTILAILSTLGLCTMALAESHEKPELVVTGDAEAGGEAFNRQCVACHVVMNDEGEIVAGRKAKTGPNLYGVALRQLGSVEDFRYGKSIVELGEGGTVWNEEQFVGYVQDPTAWLRETLDDKKARGKMAFKVRKEEDAVNLWAYLVSIGPEMEMMDKEEGESTGSDS